MSIDSRQCSECGSTDWRFLFENSYPDRRRERDRTVMSLYVCNNCGAEGKHFDQQNDGTEQFTKALR
jgi:hypothetical protein